jgi:hypothetical protein
MGPSLSMRRAGIHEDIESVLFFDSLPSDSVPRPLLVWRHESFVLYINPCERLGLQLQLLSVFSEPIPLFGCSSMSLAGVHCWHRGLSVVGI